MQGPATESSLGRVVSTSLDAVFRTTSELALPRPEDDAARAAALPFGGGTPKVSVVVPALNEALNLSHVLPAIPSWVHEVILVDGDSSDATVDVALSLCPGLKVVSQGGRGKGNALMAGADFAKGSRFAQGGGTEDISWFRWLGNTGFVVLGNLLFRSNYTDLCYGYNAFWRSHLGLLGLDADGFEIETMMNLRALSRGLRVVEIPSFEARRKFGNSRLRALPDGFRVLRTILGERLSSSTRRWEARLARRRRLDAYPLIQEEGPPKEAVGAAVTPAVAPILVIPEP